MLQEGLIETLAVHQEYAHIFTELCHQHLGGTASHAREWNRGAELVFTWRKSGVLEIWADGQLVRVSLAFISWLLPCFAILPSLNIEMRA